MVQMEVEVCVVRRLRAAYQGSFHPTLFFRVVWEDHLVVVGVEVVHHRLVVEEVEGEVRHHRRYVCVVGHNARCVVADVVLHVVFGVYVCVRVVVHGEQELGRYVRGREQEPGRCLHQQRVVLPSLFFLGQEREQVQGWEWVSGLVWVLELVSGLACLGWQRRGWLVC